VNVAQDAGIWRLRWNGPKKLRLRPRLDRLLQIVGQGEQRRFLQKSAVRPETCRFAFWREADRNGKVWIACHRRQRRRETISRRNDGIEAILPQCRVDSVCSGEC